MTSLQFTKCTWKSTLRRCLTKITSGKNLFYDTVNHITGGVRHHEAWAGIDYIKVNFHKDNFVVVDKVIDVLAPLSDVDHTIHHTLYSLHIHFSTTAMGSM